MTYPVGNGIVSSSLLPSNNKKDNPSISIESKYSLLPRDICIEKKSSQRCIPIRHFNQSVNFQRKNKKNASCGSKAIGRIRVAQDLSQNSFTRHSL